MGSFERIRDEILPKWLEHFQRKNADYSSPRAGTGDLEVEPHTVLGTAGQFADIWRKVWKLKKALWDKQSLTGEQPDEILFDLIGHCFLTLDLLRPAPRTPAGGVQGYIIADRDKCNGCGHSVSHWHDETGCNRQITGTKESLSKTLVCPCGRATAKTSFKR